MRVDELTAVVQDTPSIGYAPVYIRVGDELIEVDKAGPGADTYGFVLTPAQPLALERPVTFTRQQALEYLRDRCDDEIPAEIVALLSV